MEKIIGKKFDKKILIQIITRKIPHGVLATRVCLACETLETNPENILRKILTNKIWKKKLEKKFGKKILIHIITRKIPRGVLATRVCLACETLETNPENILRKILTNKIWKKKLEKKFGKKILIHIITRKIPCGVLGTRVCLACETLETNPENILRKILTNKIWKKKLEKKFGKKILIHIITRKIPRGVLATRVCLACETLKTNPENILRKILTNKIRKKKLEKKFGKKILIHIKTRKIPRGVLATRVCLACETLEKNPEKIFRKILTKKIGKKI